MRRPGTQDSYNSMRGGEKNIDKAQLSSRQSSDLDTRRQCEGIEYLRAMVFKLQHTSECTGGLVDIDEWPLPPRVSDVVGWKWGLSICIFNKFLSNADAVPTGTTH